MLNLETILDEIVFVQKTLSYCFDTVIKRKKTDTAYPVEYDEAETELKVKKKYRKKLIFITKKCI